MSRAAWRDEVLAELRLRLIRVERLLVSCLLRQGQGIAAEGVVRRPRRPDELEGKAGLARRRTGDVVERLLEGVYCACYDWSVDGREPELDQERVRRAVKRRLAGMVAALRAEIARRGLTPGELDDRLRWPAGRTERVLAEPLELGVEEADLLCQELGTSMASLFEASL